MLCEPVLCVVCKACVDDGQCFAVEWAGSLSEGVPKNKIETGQKMKIPQTDLLLFKYLLFASNYFSLATGLSCVFCNFCFLPSTELGRKSSTRKKLLDVMTNRSISSSDETMTESEKQRCNYYICLSQTMQKKSLFLGN
jgi:hypothetical protein